MKDNSCGHWNLLPDPDLLRIFSHLNKNELINASFVCSSWYRVSNDDFLWKDLFIRDWKIDRKQFTVPKNGSWKAEYIRLSYHVPSVLVETLTSHIDQVLHIAFSNNGKYFSTCSKDSRVKLWSFDKSRAKLKYEENMSKYEWKYTQFSQFNSSDTLLMVSGVFTGLLAAGGEIIVFNITDGLAMQCRVPNKPYDVFGTWYNENYLLAGNIHTLDSSTSCSSIWLNKAWQETQSECKPVLKRLYKFQNKHCSSIRSLYVVKCLAPALLSSTFPNEEMICDGSTISNTMPLSSSSSKNVELSVPSTSSPIKTHNIIAEGESGPMLSDGVPVKSERNSPSSPVDEPMLAKSKSVNDEPKPEPNKAAPESQKMEQSNNEESYNDDDCSVESDSGSSGLSAYSDTEDYDHDVIYYIRNKENGPTTSVNDEYTEFVDSEVKLLMFTCGSQTFTPHKIGFKKIEPFKFENTMNHLNIASRLKERNNVAREDLFENYFDKPDEVIDFKGHIIGMATSPDQRYLYVNCRSWPDGAVVTDSLQPPPIAQEIDIHVVDLVSLKRVQMFCGHHKAFTPNNDCFFIFLDVCSDYVASGAEDGNAYLWDRHYNVMLNSFAHDDVVNCVAFHPNDPESLLTVSDDGKIKVWMSRKKVKNCGFGESNSVSAVL